MDHALLDNVTTLFAILQRPLRTTARWLVRHPIRIAVLYVLLGGTTGKLFWAYDSCYIVIGLLMLGQLVQHAHQHTFL